MKINMQQWADQVMSSPVRKAIPILTHPGIQLIGRKVSEAVTDGYIHYCAIKRLQEEFPSAAATTIMDLTVEAEAFGCQVRMEENEIPSVALPVISKEEDIQALKIPSLLNGRIPEYLKAMQLAAEHIIDRPVLGGCIGPFSLAGRLMGMTEIMTEMFLNPDMVFLLLEKCTFFLIRYAEAVKETGVHGIIMAEPAAGLLSADQCDAFSSSFIRRIVRSVQDENFLFILHNCGNAGHCTASMVETGAGALHFGNAIDLQKAISEVPDHILVLGNLDPVTDFCMATPEEMLERTLKLLEKVGKNKNFILSSGCDVPPQAPLANIRAFYQALLQSQS
ncbi:MAG TPA: uroporphyrinogen decarboxylase family protein [Bacteroidales bacterium]|nr:uroporphyrinogen decarboxylase family protein [Bacteroidales bacterium]HQK36578.1 uroporphyrinogen decarboxylase family protein [Bacteroidales bacterium]